MSIEIWQQGKEQEVRELKELLNNGHITAGEFEELVEDIIDMQKINEDLSLEDNKIKAQKAIDAIKVIAGLL